MGSVARKHNPFINSATGGRALSTIQLPFFRIRPPLGYGVLTTTGRKTGKARSRCLRAALGHETAYLVAIKGVGATAWAQNALASPAVRLRVAGGTYVGRVREPSDEADREEARKAFCKTVYPFDYLTWINWRRGRPTRAKIELLLSGWFETGTPLVVDLAR